MEHHVHEIHDEISQAPDIEGAFVAHGWRRAFPGSCGFPRRPHADKGSTRAGRLVIKAA